MKFLFNPNSKKGTNSKNHPNMHQAVMKTKAPMTAITELRFAECLSRSYGEFTISAILIRYGCTKRFPDFNENEYTTYKLYKTP